MTQPSSRDFELLSAYLDGQLSQTDTTRLESRIKADPELRSVYDGLRQTRALLRQLPSRRAPRNFRLTPQMVGIKPSTPRIFPVFRLASVFATLLLLIGYGINLSASAASMAAPTTMAYDTYMAPAGNGAAEIATQPEPTPETAAPKFAPTAPTSETPEIQQNKYAAETPSANRSMANISPNAESQLAMDSAPAPTAELPVHPGWLFGLLGLAVFSSAGAFIVHLRARQSWHQNIKLTRKDILLITLTLVVAALLAAGIYWMSVR